MSAPAEVRWAYRSLLRYGKAAVGYQYPQVLVVRNYLRRRFRDSQKGYNVDALQNTVKFVKAAADWTGLERRCIATMVHYEHSMYEREKSKQSGRARYMKQAPYADFDTTWYNEILESLNTSMNLLL